MTTNQLILANAINFLMRGYMEITEGSASDNLDEAVKTLELIVNDYKLKIKKESN
jgi:hypothetical protein